MHRNASVSAHDFAMVPRPDVPRSAIRMDHTLKTTFDAGYLVPVYCEEMVPGDTFNVKATMFCRLATPLFPVMDNLHFDVFYFFVPNRILWTNWKKFLGERTPNPDSSISYVIPQCEPTTFYPSLSLQDYFGLPAAGVVVGAFTHSALPLRAYNLIWNEWFRDQNLQESVPVLTGDGPDASPTTTYTLLRRGKRHDYFTSCLPWPQKGTAVSMPLGATAPIIPTGTGIPTFGETLGSGNQHALQMTNGNNAIAWEGAASTATTSAKWRTTNLVADLSAATSATINAIRLAFQTQKFLERDARSGTRYVEIILGHFNVRVPDFRAQRPEYLGGSSDRIAMSPIPQTSATNVEGSDTPQGNLSAVGNGLSYSGFTYSATEHGYVIGLVNVRADLTYQYGLRRHWSRSTRYDFFWPVFSAIGEKVVYNREIYCLGAGNNDDGAFGYQEAWAEMRYVPSQITGLMRSAAGASSVDAWHYAQEFGSLPTLGPSFITDQSDDVVSRTTAVGAAADGQQFLLDCLFENRAARPMPVYSVPGLIDHF